MTRGRRVVATAELMIDAPCSVVYEWATSPERVVLWVKDLVESRPLCDGVSLEVGARSVEVIKVGGKLLEVPAQVTALEAGRLIENRLDLPDGPATSRTEVVAARGGCAVSQTMVAVFVGMRLVPAPLLSRLVRQRLVGDLRRLKKLVESR